jgi:hypothetical protein
MAKSSPKRRPGDVILDRYMPDATLEEREAARTNLYGFVAVLLRIATREALDNVEKSIRANGVGEVESESLTTRP